MRLRPLQIVGLVAMIVFGGYLIYTLARPAPDPFRVPGAQTLDVAASEPPVAVMPPASGETAAPGGETAAEELVPIDKPLEVGSQEARDDLYCSGLLFAANPPPDYALNPTDEGRRYKAQMQALGLAESGVAHLRQEGAAAASQTSRIADAWAELAARDLDAGEPKLSLEECAQRAEALPPV